jgi:hypothetical protein
MPDAKCCALQLPRQFGEEEPTVLQVIWLQKPGSYFSNGVLRQWQRYHWA